MKHRNIPKNAMAPPEGRKLTSRSEIALPLWNMGPRSEKTAEGTQAQQLKRNLDPSGWNLEKAERARLRKFGKPLE